MKYSDGSGRITSLDSLRGVAALVVVWHHLLLVRPEAWVNNLTYVPFSWDKPWSWLYATPLSLLVNGPASVLIFFVLSGLVLALSFSGRDDQDYVPFLIKRLMRIWPPFAAAILISATLQWLVQGIPPAGVSAWFFGAWSAAPSLQVIANHLDLTQIVASNAGELDGPMWSLVHEFRISLIFPVIVYFAFRRPSWAVAAFIALMFVSYLVIAGRHGELVSSLGRSGLYAWLFVAGAVMAANLRRVRAVIAALPERIRTAIWIAAFGLLMFERIGDVGTFAKFTELLAAGIGAIAIVALCTTENIATRLLEMSIPTWLGKVSYSLYLIHLPVMVAVFYLFPRLPYLFDMGISFVCALLAAEILYRTVEKPSTRLGKNWALRFAEPAGIPAQQIPH